MHSAAAPITLRLTRLQMTPMLGREPGAISEWIDAELIQAGIDQSRGALIRLEDPEDGSLCFHWFPNSFVTGEIGEA